MKINTSLDLEVIAVETENEVSVLIELTAPTAEPADPGQETPARTLQVVLDRSGSMSSENKMEDAKKAARELVDRLRPDDTLSIVTFETNAAVLAPATRASNKAALKAKIDTIQPGGGTNIYDGM